ncbi:hypothetical protein JCM33374_g4420 [Metschnikowia sp. JCM 33374]|nr:hypothetical protein JCM33374_g4420 [Metschnikowia sp. JCM 33374]
MSEELDAENPSRGPDCDKNIPVKLGKSRSKRTKIYTKPPPLPAYLITMTEEKLSKKQQKALSFRKSKEERNQEKAEKKTKKEQEKSLKRKAEEPAESEDKPAKSEKKASAPQAEGEPEKKKRKTRRGHPEQNGPRSWNASPGFRDRKINVELTVGGGGNSEVRQQKLKEKNDKLMDERKEKVKKELAKRSSKEQGSKEQENGTGGMHPARAALLKQ